MRLKKVQGGRLIRFQPRNFKTGKPAGDPIIWDEVNCLSIQRDGVAAVARRFLKQTTLKTTIITEPATDDDEGEQAELFRSAMNLYRNLLPDRRERDTPQNIVR